MRALPQDHCLNKRVLVTRCCLDPSRAERLFGFKVRTTFANGLSKAIKWYREVGAHATLASHGA